MSRLHHSSPLAPVSGNTSKSPPTFRRSAADALPPMDRKFASYGNEPSENITYELPDAHSSDSSYDLRILEEMRTQREAQYARRKQQTRSAKDTPGKTPGRLTPGISQRILAYQPRSNSRLPQIESESEDTGTVVRPTEREAQDNRPLLTRVLQSVAVERDPHVTITKPVRREPEVNEAFLQAVEDSPLSRKSSARGTPASVQARKGVGNRSDTWDLTGDLNDQLGFASTPAPFRHRNKLLLEEGSDGDEETEDISLPIAKPILKETASPERETKRSPLAPEPKAFRSALESLPTNTSETPWKQPPRATDSLDVLRQLARSVSTTPSPPRTDNALEPPKREASAPYSSRSTSKANADDSETKFVSALGASSRDLGSLFGVIKKENAPQVKTPNTQPAASRWSQREVIQSAQSKNTSNTAVPETPLITGAFVNTPATIKEKVESKPTVTKTSDDKQSLQPKLPTSPEKPVATLPKSAISSIVQRAKQLPNVSPSPGSTAATLGENTVNSLEDMMEVTSDSGIDTGNNTETMDTLDLLRNLDNGGDVPITQNDKQALAQLIEHNLATTLPFSQGLPPSVEEQRLIRQIVEARMKRTMKREVKRVMKESSEKSRSDFKDDKKGTTDAPKPKAKDERSEGKQTGGISSWPGFSILTPRKKGRMEEELQLQRMSDHVNTMHSRTRELKADMSRLEKKLIAPETCTSCKHPVIEHARDCPALNSPMFSRAQSLFWNTDAHGSRHLTGLGLTLLITSLWALTEMTLVFIKCEPLYVSFLHSNYYGPFREGSRPPFLLIKTLLDPINWMFATPGEGVGGILGWIMGTMTWFWRFICHLWSDDAEGFSFGFGNFITARSTTSNTVLRYAAKTTEVVTGGEWGSMNDDEVL